MPSSATLVSTIVVLGFITRRDVGALAAGPHNLTSHGCRSTLRGRQLPRQLPSVAVSSCEQADTIRASTHQEEASPSDARDGQTASPPGAAPGTAPGVPGRGKPEQTH